MADEKKPGEPGFFELRSREPSGSLDVAGLLALRALRDFEGDLLAFLQRLESRHVDRGEMREEIFAASIGGNEAETLRIIEPLHGTCCHFCNSLNKNVRRADARPMFHSQGQKSTSTATGL